VAGFSYDMINGLYYISYGFGWGGGNSVNQLVNYETSVLTSSSLGTQQLGRYEQNGNGVAVPFYYTDNTRTTLGANAPGPSNIYSTFLMTYGVWFPDGVMTGTYTETYTFTVPVAATFAWEFACDDHGSFSIDGNVISTVADNNYRSSVTGTVFLTGGTHTISWTVDNENREGAVGIRITDNTYSPGFDVWSTLDTMVSTWGELGRVAIQDLTPNVPYPLYYDYYTGQVGLLTPTGSPYSSYFQNGSVYMVMTDGYGNITITPNNLQNLSGNSSTDLTLANAQFLFYYYANNSNAISQIGSSGLTTQYFTGFDHNGNVTTITVPTPEGGLDLNNGGSGGDTTLDNDTSDNSEDDPETIINNSTAQAAADYGVGDDVSIDDFGGGGAGGGGGGGCPAPWIKITLADKSVVEAKDVKVGMQVYTRHENKDVWGNYPVIAVKPGQDLRWKIDFEDGRQFTGTFNHPLYTQDRGWVEIRDLKIGDQITEPGGTFAVVKEAKEDGYGEIIKITVDDAHTYLTEGFLSHNKAANDGDNED
jgi:hypothetical protein